MIPYLRHYCDEKIKKYKEYIKPNQKGIFSIKYSENKKFDGYLYEVEESLNESTIELKQNDEIWMRISPHEIQGCYESVNRAKGKVGVLGLGLGYFTQEVAKKSNVNEVVVYEISEDVIALYKNNFGENTKIRIVQGDGFEAKGEKFDFFFVDIYQYKLSIDVVEHYKKLMALHEIEEYSFWGVEHFILSCPLHKIAWVYIPEHWMEMSKELFNKFSQSKYIDYFNPINEEVALNLLEEFDKVL